MGFFSWHTQDTDRSIANRYSVRPTFTVYMHDHTGHTWKEENYRGYGVFGGKDFFELLAEMNGLETRDDGIKLFFSNPPKAFLSPNLTELPAWKYENRSPVDCSEQGYFYDEEWE